VERHDGLYKEVYMLLLDKLLKEEISLEQFDQLRGRLKKIMKE
jgi:hypothetical protein